MLYTNSGTGTAFTIAKKTAFCFLLTLLHVPHKVNISQNRLPWINKPIKRHETLKCSYNKTTRTKLQRDWNTYCAMRNTVNTKLKKAHNEYYIYIKLFDNSLKQRYILTSILEVCYHRTKWQDKPRLLVNNHLIHSTKGKANALNNHF